MVFEESLVMSLPFDEALERTKAAFAAEGFGTLTEIDLQATLAAKLGTEMGRYVIIGACNPELAARAIEHEPQIGVLLPCNVVVREADRGVVVEAMDPGMLGSLVDSEALAPVAARARELVGNALQRLTAE